MNEYFVAEAPAWVFNEAVEQAPLVHYVKSHKSNLIGTVITGILAAAVGLFLLIDVSVPVGIVVLVLTLCLCLYCLWSELTGREVKRMLAQCRADPTPKELQQDTVFFRFNGDLLCVSGSGSDGSSFLLNDLTHTYETDSVFLLEFKNTPGFSIPKSTLSEGTPEEFRQYLRNKSKHYQFYHINKKVQSFAE